MGFADVYKQIREASAECIIREKKAQDVLEWKESEI